MTSSRQIREIIEKSEPNTIFVCKDFSNITNIRNVKVILNRFIKENIIFRLIDGIYYKPKFFDEISEYVPLSIYAVARKIALNYDWNICPAGEAALNYLGLSTQVISRYIFRSDGPYRDYDIEGKLLSFRHTNNISIKNMSLKTAIVIEALRYKGKEKVTKEDIYQIGRVLNNEDKEKLLVESSKTLSWVYEIIKEIVRID